MSMNERSASAREAIPGPRLVATAAALALSALLLFLPSVGNSAPAKGPIVSSAATSLGRVLVNSPGHTLYLFEKDRNGKSACAGQCAANWPPLIASAAPRARAGVKASLLGTTKRADGRMQVTYNHHPVYTFVKDTAKGQTSGEGLNAFGADWYAISPAGGKIEKSTASAGGGGYAHP